MESEGQPCRVPNSRSPASPRPGRIYPIVVELAVERGGENMHVGVGVQHPLHPRRRGHDREEADPPRAGVLERAHGGDGRSARRQHRIEQVEVPLHLGRGNLEVVVHRLERVVVAIQPDVADPRRRDQLRDPLHHAQPRPQDRHEGQLLARDLAPGHALQWRVDLHRLRRQVLGRLVGHQGGDLAHELLEVARTGLAVPQDRELVLDERMIEDGEIGKRLGRHATNMREPAARA